ncbi:MAG: ribonuclease HII [Pseudomonadota bacterium]|nr:ribonuclease HII [Pseudomonadota bacterium]
MIAKPDLRFETGGAMPVCGVDEAGRGPLAGPVIAAAVILPTGEAPGWFAKINDSKKMSRTARETLFDLLTQHAQVGIGRAEPVEIDTINILQATMAAMTRAVVALPTVPARALIDGNRVPSVLPCPGQAIIGGDRLSLSIAAASIIAKVTRDREMTRLAASHPGYGWEHNAGYPTADHRSALIQLGPTAHHRVSFAPVRKVMSDK